MAETATPLPQAVETGSRERQQPRPKSVTVQEIDDWFRGYVDSDHASTALPEMGAEVVLPCDLATALELWQAWDKGIMPRAGGYLDQPRWWRAVLRFLNSRHAPISAAYWAAKRGSEDSAGDTNNWIEGGEDMGQAFSFDRLKAEP